MLKAALIDNGVVGVTGYFRDSEQVRYRIERVSDAWSPDFSGDDLVVVPNGADHVALFEVRDHIAAFLARGGTLACFCGFFTPWIPGNVWIHDNSKPLREVRYRVLDDPLGLMEGVELEQLTFESHGISGWWACGHIQTAHPESIVLADNFDRVVMIADTRSTQGLIVTTASGPLGDWDPNTPSSGLQRLYRNIIRAASTRQEQLHA
ncbi:MAG: hypothetical protein H0V62_00815 [Gammaproteobacteria bacterium]|nr:hypothetical protein [Gammaproteobacteria bacterium]